MTDTNKYALSSAHSNEIVSLCVTGTDRNEKKGLFRCADLNNKGHYYVFVFCKNEEISPYFSNRDRIYFWDGPSDDGFYGVS